MNLLNSIICFDTGPKSRKIHFSNVYVKYLSTQLRPRRGSLPKLSTFKLASRTTIPKRTSVSLEPSSTLTSLEVVGEIHFPDGPLPKVLKIGETKHINCLSKIFLMLIGVRLVTYKFTYLNGTWLLL